MMTQAPGGSPAVAVLRELAQGERRVALVPGALAPLLAVECAKAFVRRAQRGSRSEAEPTRPSRARATAGARR